MLCGPISSWVCLPFLPSFINQAAHQTLNTHKQGKSCPGEQTKRQKGELTLWRKHSHPDLGQEPSFHISDLSVGSRRVPSLHSVQGAWGSISTVALPLHWAPKEDASQLQAFPTGMQSAFFFFNHGWQGPKVASKSQGGHGEKWASFCCSGISCSVPTKKDSTN